MATRRERVLLELEDKFSREAAQAAAAAALLNREINSLSGNAVRSSRSTQNISRDVDRVARSADGATRNIDRFSGRLRIIADVAAILGPGLIPIGAVGVPAVAALASQFGAAALAGGTAIIAFQGIGDTLEAVNKASLEPSAENLEAARIAMQNLSPAARSFVRQLQDMQPAFDALRNAAASGLFPGLERGMDDLGTVLPNIERVLFRIGDAAGDVAAEFAEGIAGPRGQEFMAFMAREVPSALTDLGRVVGNLAAGMGELWMAFSPLNRDASDWMVDAARSFDDWATGLSQTEGFRDFVAYVRENGPLVADAMGSLANAVVQVVEAAAPLGGPVLRGIAAFADAISALANSGAGPAIMTSVTALAALNRGMAAFNAVKTSTLFAGIGTSAGDAGTKMTGMQRAAVGLAGALAGLMVVDALQGGLEDHAIGVEDMTRSLLELDSASSDMPANLDGLANSIDRLANPNAAESLQDNLSNMLGGIGNEEEYDRAVAQIESLDSALTGLVQQGHAGQAEDILGNLGLNEAQMGQLMKLLPGYRDALAGIENQSRLAGQAGEQAGRRSARGFSVAESAAEEFRRSLERINGLLEKRSNVRDYEAAIDDLRKSLRENGRTLDINTRKGRDNQAALDNIASSAIAVAENMRGTQRVQFLTQARRDFIDAAQKLGLGRQRARELATQLGLLNRQQSRPQIIVDTARVDAAIAGVRADLNAIQDEEVWVTVRRRGTGLGAVGVAEGGTIGGRRHPYGDKVLSWLAPGEEVISNRYGQADRHRELLKAINSNRYAGGGTVGRPSVTVGGPTVNVGGPTVRVQIDSRDIRAVVRSEMAHARTYDDRLDDRD